jgi:hypothetical protein
MGWFLIGSNDNGQDPALGLEAALSDWEKSVLVARGTKECGHIVIFRYRAGD